MMVIYIKQHIKNIWSSFHEKVNDTHRENLVIQYNSRNSVQE